MSRLCDGVDDQIAFTVPASGINVNGAHTLLIVVRIIQTSDLTWLSFIETETSAAAAGAAMGRSALAGGVYWSQGATLGEANTITDSDGWMICAASKASGSSIPRLHRSIIGGANTHTDWTGALAAAASIASGTIRIGGNDDFANIRVAAAAIFDKVLTDAEINGINTAKTTKSIYDLTPVWLVDDNDAFVADYMGHSGNGTKTGTASDADNPSGWVYGVGGATVTFAVSISGQAGVTAAKVLTRSLAASVAGQGAVSPAVVLTRSLAAAIAGQGTPVVALTVSAGGVVSFAVDISGQAAVAPDMVRQISLAASVAGQGGVVGQIAFLRLLAAVVAGQGAVAPGNLNVFRGFAATVAGQAALTAALADIIGLQALIAGQGAVAVSTTETKRFAASIAGQAAIVVALTGGLRWLQEQIIANIDPLVPAIEGSVDLLTAAAIGSTDLLVAQVEDSH